MEGDAAEEQRLEERDRHRGERAQCAEVKHLQLALDTQLTIPAESAGYTRCSQCLAIHKPPMETVAASLQCHGHTDV